ncbi:MAG TPA: tetratricopeptide repeat protein [Chthonomonadaceae bacterium]|nr:tetratricopeptide repeat protein [Chthonomonadaceae bacterium]
MDQVMRWLQQADRLLLSGQLSQAEKLCRRVLGQKPDHEEALMLLGTVFLQQAKKGAAVECYLKAAALQPRSAAGQTALGMAAHVQGQYAQAAMYFQMALELEPDAEETRVLLNNTLLALGKPLDTGRLVADTLLAPAGAPVGRPSAPSPQPALPRNAAEREFDLGVVLLKEQQFVGAEARFRKAVALRPNYPDALNNLGFTLRMLGRLEESVDAYRRALELRADTPLVYDSLGISLQMLYRFTEAEAIYARALEIAPNDPIIHRNRGVLYLSQNRCEAAAQCFRQALTLQPDSAEAQMNLGITLLKQGQFEEGWAAYAARLKMQATVMDTLAPRWDGSPLEGRTILLYAEQGLGDAIQFVRYIPLVKACGGRVVLVCQAGLKRLFANLEGVEELVEGTPTGAATLPPFQVQASLLSLPEQLQTRLETIPSPVPYLHPETEKQRDWQHRLAAYPGFKVGIVWAGNPEFGNDRNRSCRLSDFTPHIGLPGVQLFSLQKDAAALQIANLPKPDTLTDLAPDLHDFTDTAAVIANLDLVISVDTSVAHLAGAMGAPVWTLLPFAPDWRWLLDRADTPWYPTMRLFRQPQPTDWASVFQQVTAELTTRI